MQDFDPKSTSAAVRVRQSIQAALRESQKVARKKGQPGAVEDESLEESREKQDSRGNSVQSSDEQRFAAESQRDPEQQEALDAAEARELLEIKEILVYSSAPELASEDRALESEESNAPVKSFVYSTTDFAQEQKVTREKLLHSDTFTSQALLGRDEYLCAVSPVRGEEEYVHTAYTGELDPSPQVNNPNNLCSVEMAIMGPASGRTTSQDVFCISLAAESYVQQHIDASGITTIEAEFPRSFDRMWGEEGANTEERTNIMALVRHGAHQSIGGGLMAHDLLRVAEKVKHLKDSLGLGLAA